MKKLFVSMAFVLVAGSAFAQMDAVKNATKAAGKGDFATATSLIEQALNNPETANLADTWFAAGQVQQKISAKQLENQVKRQNYDENAMFNASLQMVKYFLKADELPDAKGKMNAFTSKMASAIKGDLGNLINGGVAAFNGGGEGSDARALDFFGTYVDLAKAPMFAKDNLAADPQYVTIAYYAALAGIRSENYAAVEKFAPMAQADAENGQNATEFLVEAYKKQGKTDQMMSVLKDALDKYPGNQAFFANMIDYYTSNNKYDEAQAFADQMIAKDSGNYFYNYVKGFLYSQQKDDDKAIEQYEQAIQKNPEYAQSYAELGKSWVLKAQDFSETAESNPTSPKFAEDAKTLRGFYEKAMPYLEKCRQLAPDNVSLWKQALSSVYYNLQMTDKYEEVQQAY
ncbi:MAG: tetratricopeptide repeat protein [Bacteroidaceae bacterium]|jgi:tetratricopeptide (TPR) repeat protein|nr:tetratricopeptide repeat protein [Bacteroidaceae bacterium]